MRYKIKHGKIVESTSIDAPYDTQEDALADLLSAINHCQECNWLIPSSDKLCLTCYMDTRLKSVVNPGFTLEEYESSPKMSRFEYNTIQLINKYGIKKSK